MNGWQRPCVCVPHDSVSLSLYPCLSDKYNPPPLCCSAQTERLNVKISSRTCYSSPRSTMAGLIRLGTIKNLKSRLLITPNFDTPSHPKKQGDPATPLRGRMRRIPRRRLFSKRTDPGMLFFCVNKKWRSNFKNKMLPSEVMVGLRIPWMNQKCKLCPARISSLREAMRHMRMCHKAKKLIFLCFTCAGYRCSMRQSIAHASKCKKSYETITSPKGNFNCSHCSKTFKSQRGLSQHRRRMHLSTYLNSPTRDQEAHTPMSGDSGVIINALSGTTIPQMDVVSGLKTSLMMAMKKDEFKHVAPKRMSYGSLSKKVSRMIISIQELNGIIPRGATTKNPFNRGTSSGRAKAKFRRTQNHFASSMKDLASEILDGAIRLPCGIPKDTIWRAYKDIWETPDKFVGLGAFGSCPKADNSQFELPILPEDVLMILKAMKPKSAPGPDGIGKLDILRWDPTGIKLAKLFNTMLLKGKIPSSLKKSRTVLIPKGGPSFDESLLIHWRPITLSSVILKTFSGLITKRLSEACKLHPRQRGFIQTPGCAENISTLNGLILKAKKDKRSLAVVFIDFAKAFDSVSHTHIDSVLRQRGVDRLIRGLVKNSYKRCYSAVQTSEGLTPEIALNRGVKQGDPMSPILFDLALDPLISSLELHGMGISITSDVSITTMAYADDLVLLSDSHGGMSYNISILEKFSRDTGLEINPSKCMGFMIKNGRAILNFDKWKIFGHDVENASPTRHAKYLGVQFNPWKGIVKPQIKSQVKEMLRKISEAPLKPTQKLDILRSYAIPRIVYVADHSMIPKSSLDECDREIRTCVRSWFHLHPSVVNGLLYCAYEDGGLGIQRLGTTIPAIQARRQIKLLSSEDPVTRSVTEATVNMDSISKSIRRLCGVVCAPSLRSLRMFDLEKISAKAMKTFEFQHWCKAGIHGKEAGPLRKDKISNCWLRSPISEGFTQSDFILSLKIRSNSIPVKASVMTGKTPNTICRGCLSHPETLDHVLNVCKTWKLKRMKRHNRICNLLSSVLRSLGWKVDQERRIYLDDGRQGVPDLVAVKNNTAVIIDVTVPLNNDDKTLSKCDRAKICKYSPFTIAIERKYPEVTSVTVWGFPVSAKGKWYTPNAKLLTHIGIKSKQRMKSIARCCVKLALWGSVNICKEFLKIKNM